MHAASFALLQKYAMTEHAVRTGAAPASEAEMPAPG
jgi:hypothetical protein